MKKIVYILGIICAMIMQSCLDLEPKTQLADTNYWKSPEHFKLFATQFYSWSADFRWLDDSQHADIRSDLFAGSTVNIYSNGTNSIPSSDKHYADNYNRIRQTNTLLQQADTYEQQADIAISVGEARFFRAYCYFELLQAYGDLIITRTPLDIDSSEMQKARNPRTEVADFIIDDLKEAAKLLPVDKAISSSDEGRLSSEAALAFLSRVALYEGTWEKFHNGGQNTERTKDLLNTAAQAAHDVMAGGAFELFAPQELGTEAYKYLFILENEKSNPASINKTGNKEYIFTRRHDPVINSIGFNITQGRLGNALYVTRKMANMYLQSNGLPINPQTWNYTKVDDEYKNRDNRMNNQLMVPGQTYWGTNGGRIDWSGDAAEIANASHRNFMPQTGTGYFPHKWCSERDGVPTGMEAYDFPVIRYAEVLLNYAEAMNEAYGPDQAPGDYALTALDALQLVRDRASLQLPIVTAATRDEFREAVKHERRIELAFEDHRYWDLLRWKDAMEVLNKPVRGVKVTKTGEGKWSYTQTEVATRTFLERNYYMPFTRSEVENSNHTLEQNPGY